MIITIDGPTASGKSSVSRMLAGKLNAYYLYTGLLYRAVAYVLLREYGMALDSISKPDLKLVDTLIEQFRYHYSAQNYEQIFYGTNDITPLLKNPIIDQAASLLSTHSGVRERLNQLQKKIALNKSIVIDGRDSGSVVFPNADFKFFLTASVQVRAERWHHQQIATGKHVAISDAVQEIATRDTRDSKRAHAPLIIPQSARVVDNSAMNISQTVDVLLQFIQFPKSKPQQAPHLCP